VRCWISSSRPRTPSRSDRVRGLLLLRRSLVHARCLWPYLIDRSLLDRFEALRLEHGDLSERFHGPRRALITHQRPMPVEQSFASDREILAVGRFFWQSLIRHGRCLRHFRGRSSLATYLPCSPAALSFRNWSKSDRTFRSAIWRSADSDEVKPELGSAIPGGIGRIAPFNLQGRKPPWADVALGRKPSRVQTIGRKPEKASGPDA